METVYREELVAARRRAIVTRSETFVADNLADSIVVTRLSRINGVSERTLRNAFYQTRGGSPKRVLSRLRLEKAREALLRGDADTTVAAVATEHGFFELGRFAGQYRAAFGESPSATLRRSHKSAVTSHKSI